MIRTALKDFTFSDGTRVPKGTYLYAVSGPRHRDEEIYPDAATFKGFRFSDMREMEGESTKNQMVSTSTNFLLFGHGSQAWCVDSFDVILYLTASIDFISSPGRFFAVNELKLMLAHIVLTYDLNMTDIPQETYAGLSVVPDMNAQVWFRKRRV